MSKLTELKELWENIEVAGAKDDADGNTCCVMRVSDYAKFDALLRAEETGPVRQRPKYKTNWRCGGSKIIMATQEEQESYGELDIVCPGCPDCQGPEASEFTKRYRDLIKLSEEHLSKNKIGRLQTYGKEACNIIDSQAAELKAKDEKYNTLKNQVIDMSLAIIGWRKKLSFNSEDDLIGELERMINEALKS